MSEIEKKLRLSDLKKGDEAHIAYFIDDDAGLIRLRDMGLHSGIAFRIVNFAPLGKSNKSLVIIPSEFSSFVLLVINCLIIFC